jgi:hypothetical protein
LATHSSAECLIVELNPAELGLWAYHRHPCKSFVN